MDKLQTSRQIQIMVYAESQSTSDNWLKKSRKQDMIFENDRIPQVKKLNFMSLSCPVSDVTKSSVQSNLSKLSLNNSMQQVEEVTLGQLDMKFSQQGKVKYSNLQALQSLPRRMQRNKQIIIWCKTEFPLVRAVAVGEFGWTPMSRENHRSVVDIIWTDTYVTEEYVKRLWPYQKINHFPHSTQMGRKDSLFANLNKMYNRFPQDYNFYAKTWIFPEDYQRFKQDTFAEDQKKDKFYIVKPVASCQGKGIHLNRRLDVLSNNLNNSLIVQEYIDNTLLIDGLKFDMRVYVLIKSLSPLVIYVYKEGLTRLATNKYERPNDSNYRNGRIHLTNYAINKNNPEFVHNTDFREDYVGHKRSLASLYEEIHKMGGDVQTVKEKIYVIIVKTVLAVYEKMTCEESKVDRKKTPNRFKTRNITIIETEDDDFITKEIKTHRPSATYQQQAPSSTQSNSQKCFQLLGFDIMINDQFEPKLIEINHQPSLTSSSPLDYIIKKCLLMDVFNLLNVDTKKKEEYWMSLKEMDAATPSSRGLDAKWMRKEFGGVGNGGEEKEKEQQLGGFSCVYPCESRQLMAEYQKLIPQLQQNNNKSRGNSFALFNANKINGQLRNNFLLNKKSLSQKRKQYTCNYINMFNIAPPPENQRNFQNQQIIFKENGRVEERREANQSGLRTYGQNQNNFLTIKITPRAKLNNMTEYEVPKKNLNFTIKYKSKKNQSQSKRSEQKSVKKTVNHEIPQPTIQHNSRIPSNCTLYSKPSVTKTKNFISKIQLTNDHSNNMSHMKQFINTQHRHSSHDNRAGRLQNGNDTLNKTLEVFTKSILIGNQARDNKSAASLEKYEYPIMQKERNHSTVNSQRASTGAAFSRSVKKSNNDLFDRTYAKQLLTKITKMKSMKEKLQNFQHHAIAKKQSTHQFLAIKNQNCRTVQGQPKDKRERIQSQNSLKAIEKKDCTIQKKQPSKYQPIKLIQFQSPLTRGVSSTREQKSIQIMERFNNSLQIFKDEGFHSQRRKIQKQDHVR